MGLSETSGSAKPAGSHKQATGRDWPDISAPAWRQYCYRVPVLTDAEEVTPSELAVTEASDWLPSSRDFSIRRKNTSVKEKYYAINIDPEVM